MIEVVAMVDGTVTYKIVQGFKGTEGDNCAESISWMSVIHEEPTADGGAEYVCQKIEEVCYGVQEETYTTKCGVDNMATITIAVHDGQFESDTSNPVIDGSPV